MEKRTLGTTGLVITPIALGTMQFLWPTTEKEAFRLLDTYYDWGGNMIDTADMYTQWASGCQGGEAETIIGTWMKKRKNRKNVILSSKVRSRMWEGPTGEGLSRKHILKACDNSLKRLNTEYLDLYFSHWPDEGTPEEETLTAYQTLMTQGKIRFIGCSNYAKEQLEQTLQLGSLGLPTYSVIQALYNIIDRTQFETALLPLCRKYHLGVLAYSPLASGFLTNSSKNNSPRSQNPRSEFLKTKMTKNNYRLLEVLEECALTHHATISQIALAWLLQQPPVSGLLTGAETVEQLKENIGALQVNLTRKERETLDEFM